MNYWNFLRWNSQFSVCRLNWKSSLFMFSTLPLLVFCFSQLNCFSVRLIFHQFLVSGLNVGILCHQRWHCPFTRVYKFMWSGSVNSSWWLLLTLSVGINSHCALIIVVRYQSLIAVSSLMHSCTSPYLVNKNHKNQLRNLGIKPRIKRFQNHIDENLELWTPWLLPTQPPRFLHLWLQLFSYFSV